MNPMDRDFEVKQFESEPSFEEKIKMPENLKEAVSQAVIAKAKKLTPYLLMAAFLIAAGFAGYFWYEASALKKNPQRTAQEETRKLLANVSALIVLPEGETPTIATVSDPEKLKDQPFFARAKKGDKVLIYTNARKAFLYDGENNKIVEVAPINIGNPTSKPESTPIPKPESTEN